MDNSKRARSEKSRTLPRDRAYVAPADLQHALERIRQAACRDKVLRFTSLWHHVYNVDRLRKAYFKLKRKAAAGVDHVTWEQYGEDPNGYKAERTERSPFAGQFISEFHDPLRAAVRSPAVSQAHYNRRSCTPPQLSDERYQPTIVPKKGGLMEHVPGNGRTCRLSTVEAVVDRLSSPKHRVVF